MPAATVEGDAVTVERDTAEGDTAEGDTARGDTAEGASADGRRLRGERTRRQIAEALLEMLEEGHPRPTAREVAARAGVSLRSVFHHFDDMEALYATAAGLQRDRHWSLVAPLDPSAALGVRAILLARQLSRLYEAIAPVRRVAAREERTSEVIGRELARGRRMLRRMVAEGFAPELAEMPAPIAERSLDAIDVVASWETWEQLRSGLGRSRKSCEEILANMAVSLLGGER